jgi:hypothetical protein
MYALQLIVIVLCTLATGCAGPAKDVPPKHAIGTTPMKADPSLLSPTREDAAATAMRQADGKTTAIHSAPPSAAPVHAPAIPANAAATIEPAAATAPVARNQSALQPVLAPGKPLTTLAATPTVQPRKDEIIKPVAPKPEPPLDMTTLKTRLRDTNSIGVFTKLALKNQVDDLLQQFRACYQRVPTASVASLRQPYDMLVLKVLAVVQDNDPSLARAISGSREAIWGMLADPEKFNSII